MSQVKIVIVEGVRAERRLLSFLVSRVGRVVLRLRGGAAHTSLLHEPEHCLLALLGSPALRSRNLRWSFLNLHPRDITAAIAEVKYIKATTSFGCASVVITYT